MLIFELKHGPSQQVLMNTNRSIYLPLFTHQFTQCEVRFKRICIHIESRNKLFHSFVRLLIKQVIKPLKVTLARSKSCARQILFGSTQTKKKTNANGYNQQTKQRKIVH